MWKILKIKIWIGLFFKSNKHKWSSPSPAGPLCATTVSKCYPWWAEMADSQVENFTAPQTSSALNTANQPPKGVLWLDQVMVRLHTPLTTFLPLPLPLPFLPGALSFLLLEIPDSSAPPWKEESAWWPLLRFGSLRAPGTVSCWWLAKAGFYILAQSSITGLWPLTMLCVYIVPFFSGTECFARVILLIFPTTQWGLKMARGPSSLLSAESKTKGLFWGCVASLHLSWHCLWSLPELASTSWGAGRSRVKGWPWYAAVSPGARAKLLNFFFTKR